MFSLLCLSVINGTTFSSFRVFLYSWFHTKICIVNVPVPLSSITSHTWIILQIKWYHYTSEFWRHIFWVFLQTHSKMFWTSNAFFKYMFIVNVINLLTCVDGKNLNLDDSCKNWEWLLLQIGNKDVSVFVLEIECCKFLCPRFQTFHWSNHQMVT